MRPRLIATGFAFGKGAKGHQQLRLAPSAARMNYRSANRVKVVVPLLRTYCSFDSRTHFFHPLFFAVFYCYSLFFCTLWYSFMVYAGIERGYWSRDVVLDEMEYKICNTRARKERENESHSSQKRDKKRARWWQSCGQYYQMIIIDRVYLMHPSHVWRQPRYKKGEDEKRPSKRWLYCEFRDTTHNVRRVRSHHLLLSRVDFLLLFFFFFFLFFFILFVCLFVRTTSDQRLCADVALGRQ